jgi:hypothetical protein
VIIMSFRCPLDAEYKIGRSWAGDITPTEEIIEMYPLLLPQAMASIRGGIHSSLANTTRSARQLRNRSPWFPTTRRPNDSLS